MTKKSICILFVFFLVLAVLPAQNTVGLLSKKFNDFSKGFSLVYPFFQPNVYLIDSCGQIVHQWTDQDNFVPGIAAYLLPNGNLVKAKKDSDFLDDPIGDPAAGETVEILNWDNQLLHSFTLNDSLFRPHHDIEPMPNGNILMIVWEKLDRTTLEHLGKDLDLVVGDRMLFDKIIEWDPVIDSIVWEWKARDHLVQNIDSSKVNFGSPQSFPERININYPMSLNEDWLHINSIDYNHTLDQIVLSVPEFNEFWIIDHSTTLEQARTSFGGKSNKGGDLLYRWGNPEAFESGNPNDRKLFYQHDVHWTSPNDFVGDQNFNEILLFNNRTESISQANFLNLVFDTLSWSYSDEIIDFSATVIHPANELMASSPIVSSAQKLENNNILMFSGRWGYAYELDDENKLVWEYRLPLSSGMPVEQGSNVGISANLCFRMKKYSVNFQAFENKDLSPQGYLEFFPNEEKCSETTSVLELVTEEIKLFPNPSNGIVDLELDRAQNVFVIDISGIQRKKIICKKGNNRLDLTNLAPGVFFIKTARKVIKLVLINN